MNTPCGMLSAAPGFMVFTSCDRYHSSCSSHAGAARMLPALLPAVTLSRTAKTSANLASGCSACLAMQRQCRRGSAAATLPYCLPSCCGRDRQVPECRQKRPSADSWGCNRRPWRCCRSRRSRARRARLTRRNSKRRMMHLSSAAARRVHYRLVVRAIWQVSTPVADQLLQYPCCCWAS